MLSYEDLFLFIDYSADVEWSYTRTFFEGQFGRASALISHITCVQPSGIINFVKLADL
jgi:hypothetical protein